MQIKTQNMIALLSHPCVQADSTLNKRFMRKIMASMGIDDEKVEQEEEDHDEVDGLLKEVFRSNIKDINIQDTIVFFNNNPCDWWTASL